ncbi:MAG: helix-turn-helix transcriptional regulator [Clostridia bacterium]|nr:helix-turn-helix transcriptional regulator [Clostridia bacterium]
MKKSIINRLREIRRKNNYTQEDFAEKLDISRSKVSSWENGKRDMNIKDAIKIAKECNVSLDNLFETKVISESEYTEIFKKFLQSSNITFDRKLKILEGALDALKYENIDLLLESYKMTQNATK